MSTATLDPVFDSLFHVPRWCRALAARLAGVDQARQLYGALRLKSLAVEEKRSFPELVLEQLAVTCRATTLDLRNVPARGPVIVTANHPFGILDGALLATALRQVRPDVRFLGNQLLSNIPELREALIHVDLESGRNVRALRNSHEFLRGGGCLVVFPAAEVSCFLPMQGSVLDRDWKTGAARMVETLARRGVYVPTVPAYIQGSNSLLFQAAGLFSAKLRTAMLIRELLNKRNETVELRIGTPVPAAKLLEMPTPQARTEYLRWRTYLLASRNEYKPNTSRPLCLRTSRSLAEIAQPESAVSMAEEVASLGAEALLAVAGDLEVYVANASAIPTLLRDIGRLREVTFRKIGEGTGRASDLDRFDSTYLHLFAWSVTTHQIVGAYRIAPIDSVPELYTSTLFRFDAGFIRKIGPALELGRSFVSPEYQKSFAPLLALWKGIGAWVGRNPRYRVLFGPVSISNQYQAVSRELMVSFLERRASLREWIGMVSNRNPLPHRSRSIPLPDTGFDLEDLSDVISDLEPGQSGIPVLLRQYLRLGGKLLGFNVDPEFSNSLDGLILVDLTKTEPRLVERYLGKTSASAFLKYWSEANTPDG